MLLFTIVKKLKKEELIDRYKTKRRVIIGITVLFLLILYTFKNTSLLIRPFSTISLLFLFYAVDHLFDVNFKERHYFFIIFIAVGASMLSPLYFIYPNYDKILHLILPIMFASIVFHMVSNLKMKLRWQLAFVFFVVLGFIGLHEIGEYWLDQFFDLKLQGVFLRNIQGLEKYDILLDRIDDTMIDMSIGVLGAAIYCLSIGFYHKIKSKIKHTH